MEKIRSDEDCRSDPCFRLEKMRYLLFAIQEAFVQDVVEASMPGCSMPGCSMQLTHVENVLDKNKMMMIALLEMISTHTIPEEDWQIYIEPLPDPSFAMIITKRIDALPTPIDVREKQRIWKTLTETYTKTYDDNHIKAFGATMKGFKEAHRQQIAKSEPKWDAAWGEESDNRLGNSVVTRI
jgi:hypothetical protein